MQGFVLRYAPWLPDDEAEKLIDAAIEHAQWLDPDHIGWRLRLRITERDALRITTIGTIDMDRATRERFRREKQNAKKRRDRKKKPKRKTNSEKAAELGISLRTYYRRREAGTLYGASDSSR